MPSLSEPQQQQVVARSSDAALAEQLKAALDTYVSARPLPGGTAHCPEALVTLSDNCINAQRSTLPKSGSS